MNNNYVLACIDGASLTTAVVDYAAWVAVQAGVPLKLLHNIEHRPQAAVADLSGSIGLGSQEELLEELTRVEQERSRLLREKGKHMLKAAEARAREAGVTEVEALQRHGSLQESLVEMEADIRVLVMGIRGEEHGEGQLGAHLETVIRALHRPVLVVNTAFAPPKKIMLAYDGTEASRKALDMVSASPVFENIPCTLVYVGDDAKGDAVLGEAGQHLGAAGIPHEAVQLQGKIDEALIKFQGENDVDLTVMGAFSHLRIRDVLLGSFTHKMLAGTRKPLLLLR